MSIIPILIEFIEKILSFKILGIKIYTYLIFLTSILIIFHIIVRISNNRGA